MLKTMISKIKDFGGNVGLIFAVILISLIYHVTELVRNHYGKVAIVGLAVLYHFKDKIWL